MRALSPLLLLKRIDQTQKPYTTFATSFVRSSVVSPRFGVIRSFRTSTRCSQNALQPAEEEPEDQEAKMSKPAKGAPKKLDTPRPSASVLLISPTNEVLLLHRVKTSSAFPSAHVFPGGNISDFHDGHIPTPEDPARHEDGQSYRLAAIRETFEESGILLAKNNGFGRLIEVGDEKREEGRKAVHSNQVKFEEWLSRQGGRADVGGLIPFTRWITPTNVPKRFTTQMYIYFLPLASNADPYRGPASPDAIGPVKATSSSSTAEGSDVHKEAEIPIPTPDGGLEHTTARFLTPSKWISMAQSGEIILFPPQFFLLHLVSQYLKPGVSSVSELGKQRTALRQFLKTSSPPWGQKCISPVQFMRRASDKKTVLRLDKAGPELQDKRSGDSDYVVLVDFKKEGPRNVEIRKKVEFLDEEREAKSKL